MENFINNSLTVLIPIQFDSDDRLNNIKFILDYYGNEFNFIIKETGKISHSEHFTNYNNIINYVFEYSDDDIFHKTRVLNDLYRLSNTDIVMVLDADVIIPKKNILDCFNLIYENKCDAIYPYRFNKGVNMLNNVGLNKDNIDLNIVDNIDAGYGYCVILNKNKFTLIGGENESFYGYAPEDWERHDRISRLLNCMYYNGVCYHINHKIVHSHNKQPFFKKNDELYNKIKGYDDNQYCEYIINLINNYNKK